MFGVVKNYSTPSYWPGKLVDEFGQGSSNDNYGRTLPVSAAEQVDLYRLDSTIPYGTVRGNAVPIVRMLDVVAAVFGVGAYFAGYRTLGKLAVGAAGLDIVVRQLSSNYDSAVSMIPLNRKVV